jgi:hypothetical protein
MRITFMCTAALLAGIAIFYPNMSAEFWPESSLATSASAGEPAQSKKRITVPAGTRILVRMVDSLDSSKQKSGYRFTASLETDLRAEDIVVAPRGSTV